ncbi:hypothetical protein [Emticicia fluvialis]|uniref:hypothetical protein n=1 Tax=Emticicia fluvialis TaxID=2974474 RepID=UPI002164FA9B|nr:hypothetical protein [Emticicia fluvialis]
MKEITKVSLSIIQEHEVSCNSSITLNNHNLPDFCPINEVKCYRVLLEEDDINRIYLLWEAGFNNLTKNNSFKLADLTVDAQELVRVKSFLDNRIDLRTYANLEVILFGQNLEESSLTATDGNHRLMSQFLSYKSIAEVPAYIYTHEKINNWNFIPPVAR